MSKLIADEELKEQLHRLIIENRNPVGEPTYNLIQNAVNGTIEQVVSIIEHYLTKAEPEQGEKG